MMNQVERIVIERKGAVLAIINMLDANNKVINSVDTIEMLATDDYVIDIETIAELCGMTLDKFNRDYQVDKCGYEKIIGYGVVLAEAEFSKRNVFERLYGAIQNGDIQIADDNSFNWDDEDYNDTDDDCFVSDGLAYDRAHGYILKELVRDNMGQIDHIDYVSLDDGSIVTIPKEDLYIDGVELLDYYGDCDYAFKSRLNSLIIMNQDGFEEQYEYFKAELDKFAKGLKQVGTKSNKHTDKIEQAVKSGAFAKVEEQANKVVEQLLDNKAKVETEPVVVESKPVVTNNNPVVAKLQELMVKALEEGDFDAYDKLEERLNRINK